MKHTWEPLSCFVCRRTAQFKREGKDLCVDCMYVPDFSAGKEFDEYEKCALVEAGNEGGQYLDSLGITDLAALPPESYVEFCKLVVVSFGDSIRQQIRSGKAPF